jgi:histone H3/H4
MARTKQSNNHGGKKVAAAARKRPSKLLLPPRASKKPVTTSALKPRATVNKRKVSRTEIMCRNSKIEADKIKAGKIYINIAPLKAAMKSYLPDKRFSGVSYPLMQTILHAVILQTLDNAKQVTAVSKGITLNKEIFDCVVKLQNNINKGVAI